VEAEYEAFNMSKEHNKTREENVIIAILLLSVLLILYLVFRVARK